MTRPDDDTPRKPMFTENGWKVTVYRRGAVRDHVKFRALLWSGGPKRRTTCWHDGWGETEREALAELRRKTKEDVDDAKAAHRAVGDALLEERKRRREDQP